MRNKLKWEQARPLKRPDHIQSSAFTNHDQFVPSYEKNPEHNMKFLLGMEYSRKWHEERELFHKHLFPPVERTYFPRKYVIRGLYKKLQSKSPNSPPPYKMKKFINVPARTDNKREPLRKDHPSNSIPNNKNDTSKHKVDKQLKHDLSLDNEETKSITTVSRSSKPEPCPYCCGKKYQHKVTSKQSVRTSDNLLDKPDKHHKIILNEKVDKAAQIIKCLENESQINSIPNQYDIQKEESTADETATNFSRDQKVDDSSRNEISLKCPKDTDKYNEKLCPWLRKKGTPCDKPCSSSKSFQSGSPVRSRASSKACILPQQLQEQSNKPIQDDCQSKKSTDERICCRKHVIQNPKSACCRIR